MAAALKPRSDTPTIARPGCAAPPHPVPVPPVPNLDNLPPRPSPNPPYSPPRSATPSTPSSPRPGDGPALLGARVFLSIFIFNYMFQVAFLHFLLKISLPAK